MKDLVMYAAGTAAYLLCGVAAFAITGKALNWDWTPRGLVRHYDTLAQDDERVAQSLATAGRIVGVVLLVVWVLALVAWPAQVACAPFLPHRWIGQAPRNQ